MPHVLLVVEEVILVVGPYSLTIEGVIFLLGLILLHAISDANVEI